MAGVVCSQKRQVAFLANTSIWNEPIGTFVASPLTPAMVSSSSGVTGGSGVNVINDCSLLVAVLLLASVETTI